MRRALRLLYSLAARAKNEVWNEAVMISEVLGVELVGRSPIFTLPKQVG